MIILECMECGYKRSTDEDGRQFYDVCKICYDEECPTMVGPGDLCQECKDKEGIFTDSIMN